MNLEEMKWYWKEFKLGVIDYAENLEYVKE